MRKRNVIQELPKKKSLAESIDILLVRAEFATIQRHKAETQAELEATRADKGSQLPVGSFGIYIQTLEHTLRYYEGHLNALRKVLEGLFKPEE